MPETFGCLKAVSEEPLASFAADRLEQVAVQQSSACGEPFAVAIPKSGLDCLEQVAVQQISACGEPFAVAIPKSGLDCLAAMPGIPAWCQLVVSGAHLASFVAGCLESIVVGPCFARGEPCSVAKP